MGMKLKTLESGIASLLVKSKAWQNVVGSAGIFSFGESRIGFRLAAGGTDSVSMYR